MSNNLFINSDSRCFVFNYKNVFNFKEKTNPVNIHIPANIYASLLLQFVNRNVLFNAQTFMHILETIKDISV